MVNPRDIAGERRKKERKDEIHDPVAGSLEARTRYLVADYVVASAYLKYAVPLEIKNCNFIPW